MYYISHHVHKLLSDRHPKVQFFGQVFEAVPPRDKLTSMQADAFRKAFSDPGQFLLEEYRASRTTAEQVLYLDPLYTLFGGLKSSDTVFVLDLSTVTAPHWHGHGVGRAYDEAFSLITSVQPNVVAISQNTADTFIANYGFPSRKVGVLPLYIPHHFMDHAEAEVFHSPSPYVLFVGSLEERKNLKGAIESFRLSRLGRNGYRLIIVGGNGQGGDEIRRLAREVPNVFLTGYVSEAELRALYRGARAFIYPSYLEGFGVPLLEAMHFGIPSVASVTGACPEVGGDLMRYFDPDDHLSFARELVTLVGMSERDRTEYRTRSRRRVDQHFSIATFDANLLDLVAARFGPA